MVKNHFSVGVLPILKRFRMIFSVLIALTVVSLVILLSPKLSLAAEGSTTPSSITISGTISLPSGVFAPSGGLLGEVCLYPESSQYYQSPDMNKSAYSAKFTLNQGENSVEYSVDVPINAGVSGYMVGYQLVNGNYQGYVSEGYYSDMGTGSWRMATILNPNSSSTNVNLTILTGNSIKGKLSIGEPAPTGGIDATIYVYSYSNGAYEEFSKKIYIPQGEMSADYYVTVPSSSGIAPQYQVEYDLNMSYAGLLQYGYYSELGTSPYYNSATPVNIGTTDVDNVDMTILSGKTISGTISLPEGRVAPEEGIVGHISASTQYGRYSSEFTITTGNNSADYTVTVPSDSMTTNCRIEYSFEGNDAAYNSSNGYPGYLSYGCYSSTGTKRDYSSASPVDLSSGNVTGIDLTILKGTIISGKVSLPQGEVAPAGGITGIVHVSTQSGIGVFNIPEGSSSAEYSVTVPSDTSLKDYIVGYSLNNYDKQNGYPGYISEAYYSDTETTLDQNSASPVNIASGDVTGINLTIIKGYTISGTIALAQGRVAPSDGLSGSINVSSQDFGNFGTSFYMPAGSGSTTYTVTVPMNTSVTNYKVNYYVYNYNSYAYVNNGFYSITGTTTDPESASPVDVSKGNVTGIDLLIKSGNTISGTISLPEGMTAPAGGVSGYISIVSENGWLNLSTNFRIPQGSNSANYTITASADSSITRYRLSYSLNSNFSSKFLASGYYSENGTTTDYNSVSYIDISAGDVSKKNIEILKGSIISGTIFLPQGMTAPTGGIIGSVQLTPKNGGNVLSTQFSIPSGSNSIRYSIAADPSIGDYTVQYNLYNNYSGVLGNGYYSTAGTTGSYSLASPVNVSGGDVNGIDLTILKGSIISGTIALPEGKTAPSGGLYGSIVASSSANGYDSAYFSIPSGSNSADYTLTVPPNASGEGYQVYYSLGNNYNGSYASNGYYASTGTTTSSSIFATPVDASAGDVTGIDLMIAMGKTISGTIYLPQGIVAPDGGINGSINAFSENGGYYGYSASFSIPAGSNSASYSVMVSADTAITKYRLRYDLTGNVNPLLSGGYYSNTGRITNYSSATLIDVSAGDVTETDMTILKGNTISGTISLPEGRTAPVGGLSGQVSIVPRYGGSSWSTPFTITAGNNSTTYTVTGDPTITEYSVSYNMPLGEYWGNGLYSVNGTKSSYSESFVDISSGDKTGIDLTLIKANSISGTIKLPSGNTVLGSVSGYIYISSPTFDILNSSYFYIPSGSSSYNYDVPVPEDKSNGDVLVYYSLNSNGGGLYLTNGYYSTAGTTRDSSSASPVDLSQGDVTGIDLSLMTMATISGTVTLPQGMTAPAGGISGYLNVRPQNDASVYNAPFNIPYGSSSTSYTVSVDPSYGNFRINYSLSYNSSGYGYLDSGYYSSSGTTTDYSSAGLVNVTTGEAIGINLDILMGNTISGTITLPQGMAAPAEGISGSLNIIRPDTTNTNSVNFNIPAGANSVSYTVPVDPSLSSCRVSYSLNTTSSSIGYLLNGYYSEQETTTDYNTASLIGLSGGNVTDINIDILKGTIIAGMVSLPQGITAPAEGISGSLNMYPKSGGTCYTTQFSIPGGSTSTTYSLTVDPTYTSATLSYYLNNSAGDYFGNGYYSSSGTTPNNSLASQIDLSAGDRTGIDLTLIKRVTISGTIKLPQGKTAPSDGISGGIWADSLSGDYLSSYTISSGNNSTNYTIAVPMNNPHQGYNLNYSIWNDSTGSYVGGYYSSAGTTTDDNSATLVDVSTGDATGINIIILENGSVTTPQAITLTLDNSDINLTTGQAIQLHATVTPDSVSDKSVTWSIISAYPTDAITLTDDGWVTGMHAGSALVRATSNADSSKYADCAVTVTAPIIESDFSSLISTIASAQSEYDLATEGTEVGQYPAGSKAVLQSAITAAQTIVDEGTAAQTVIDEAVTSLMNTISVFEAGRVLDDSTTLQASPVIQIGVDPDAGNVAGMYIGLDKIADSAGNTIASAEISGYEIEIDFDPNQVSIPKAIDQTDSGDLFSQNVIKESDTLGKVLVASAAGGGIANYNKLFFIPIVLKGTITELPNITVKFTSVVTPGLQSVSVPTVDNSSKLYAFQRGKISNNNLGSDPDILDAVAGLQYLAHLRNAGNGSEDVNVVNMASITESTNSVVAKPDIKDVIALLQYTVHLRDEYFAPVGQQRIASINFLSNMLTLTSPTTGSAIGLASYNVLDQNGTDITNSNLAKSVVFQSNVGSVTANLGSLELTPTAVIDLRQLSQVVINACDPVSGFTTSAALTIHSSTSGAIGGGGGGYVPPTPVLNSIAITSPPTRSSYIVGDSLDLTGLVVTGTYSDGSTKTFTTDEYTVSGFDSTTPGAITLTVTVEDKAATFTLNIMAPPPVSAVVVNGTLTRRYQLKL